MGLKFLTDILRSFTLDNEVIMDDFEAEERRLRQERAHILKHARNTKRYVNMLTVRKQPIPEEMVETLTNYRRRLEENTLLLRQLQANQPVEPSKIVGHIGPQTMRQAPDDRAAYARDLVRPFRSDAKRQTLND